MLDFYSNAVWMYMYLLTFRRHVLSPSSGQKIEVVYSSEKLISTYKSIITQKNNVDVFTAVRTPKISGCQYVLRLKLTCRIHTLLYA
jgi:hypothetical protein